MPYEMKFSIYLYDLMRSNTIIIDKWIYLFSLANNGGRIRKKLLFFDFDLHYLQVNSNFQHGYINRAFTVKMASHIKKLQNKLG